MPLRVPILQRWMELYMVMFGVVMPSWVHSLRRAITKGLASLSMTMGVMHPSET